MHDKGNAEAYLTHQNKCNNPKQNYLTKLHTVQKTKHYDNVGLL